jgi:Mrp family chromosome partitioning ATPase
VIAGRAVERSFDLELAAIAREVLDNRRPATALVVTGTAGTGKSTALMRLALTLSSDGIPVLWDDRDTRVTPHSIRERVRRESGKVALIVDDADLFGHQMSQLLLDLVPTKENFLFVVASRSTKVNAITHAVLRAKTVNLQELSVPGLSDEDIDKLIAVLDKFHRLGVLKGKSAAERRRAFSEQAGRQLLVAMINATSGERFEEKARAEVTDLEGAARYAYSLVAVASSLRQVATIPYEGRGGAGGRRQRW